jgi:hypothetical protein
MEELWEIQLTPNPPNIWSQEALAEAGDQGCSLSEIWASHNGFSVGLDHLSDSPG